MRSSAGRAERPDIAVAAGFFLTGIVTVALGPLIPELRADWGVTHSQAASLFVAQFISSSIGAVLSTYRMRLSLILGYGLIAGGLSGLAAGGWPLAWPTMAVTGLGLGLVIPASNLWIAHRNPERRGAALATLNLIWGFGAVSCPALFAVLRDLLPVEAVLVLFAVLAALSCAAVWLALARDRLDSELRRAPEDDDRGAEVKAVFLGLMATMLFLYVGAENAVGGWLVTLADELSGERAVVSLLIGSGFWGAILAGRAAAPWVLRHITEPTLFRVSVALAAGGTLLLILSRSMELLAVGALAAGLGMAPLFPLTVSMLASATADTRSRKTGWVLACGGLGGAALPWLTGQITGASAAFRYAFVVPLAGLILLAALHGAQRALYTR